MKAGDNEKHMTTKDYEVWCSVHLKSSEGKKGKIILSMQQGQLASIGDKGDAMGNILYLLVVITCNTVSRVLGNMGEVRNLPALSQMSYKSLSHLKRSKKLADTLFAFHILTTV